MYMRRKCTAVSAFAFLAVALLGVSYLSPALPQENVYVAFLDDARKETVNFAPSVSRQRVIRPAFEKGALGWHEIDTRSLPVRMRWTIAFDGKNLGQVQSQADSDDDLSTSQTIVTPVSAVPSVGSPSQVFGGVLGSPETKFRRPLVAVSKPYFRDPDGWKRTKLPDEISSLVRKKFRTEYPHVDRCKEEEIVERNWKYPDSALSFPFAYSSNKHSFLVEASLNAGECGYVSDAADPLSGPWFFVSPSGVVRRIGSFMTLLDAGDYDNDGSSEVVFFLSQGENTDGFVLYDAGFQSPVMFTWHYH
jgi:hypothetical protein